VSYELEKKYLNKDGRVNEKALWKDAIDLPKPIHSLIEFSDKFGTRNNYQAQIGNVNFSLNISGAFKHLINNTYFEDRSYISGAVFDTLHNPLIVVKKDDGYRFYKPFREGEQTLHLMSLHINQNGVAEMKTFYEVGSLKKVGEILKTPERNIVYSQYTGYTRPHSIENAGNLSTTSGVMIGDPNIKTIIPQTTKKVNQMHQNNNLDEVHHSHGGLHKGYTKEDFVKQTIQRSTISPNEENIMAFIKLTNEDNPKLAVSVDNALNYKDKDGELKQRQKETALTEVIEEAGKVSAMNKGTVSLNVSVNGKYETYFVNRDEKNNIALRPAGDVYNKDKTIYCNSIAKENGGHFYSINDKTEAGKALIDGLDTKVVETEHGRSEYVKASVRLKNDDLKAELVTKDKDHTAIVSKDGIKIVKDTDLQKSQTKEVAPDKDKKAEVKKEKPQAKVQSKGVER